MSFLGNNARMGMISFCFLVLFATSTGPVMGLETNHSFEKRLNFLRWDGSFLALHREGTACWVIDSEGNLRFEVMLGGNELYPVNLNRILNWEGTQGWTVISVKSGGGTFSRWNEEWHELPPAMDVWLRVIVSHTTEGMELPQQVRDISPGGRPLALPLFDGCADRSRVRRLQLPELTEATGNPSRTIPEFRHEMTGRGYGRGGEDTVLNLAESTMGTGGIRVTSSHRPGVLWFENPRLIPAEFSPEDVFLPWWPLSSTIEIKKGNSW